MADPVLSVRNLRTQFVTQAGVVKAVNDVSFELAPGETLGVVGESGSGKTVLSMSILGLVPSPPGEIVGGEVVLHTDDGEVDLAGMSDRQLRQVRGADVAMIFQDPMTSLNPVYKIGDQVSEPLRVHKGMSKKAAWAEGVQLLGAGRDRKPQGPSGRVSPPILGRDAAAGHDRDGARQHPPGADRG